MKRQGSVGIEHMGGWGVLACLLAVAPAAAQEYRIIEPTGTGASTVLDFNVDGSVAVGRMSIAGGGSQAYRWTLATGPVALGDLPTGNNSSYGRVISSDGSIIAGTGHVDSPFILNNDRGFLWSEELGMQFIGEDTRTAVVGLSGDGRFIAGFFQVSLGPPPVSWRWSRHLGFEYLTPPAPYTRFDAIEISRDGRHIVGTLIGGPSGNRCGVWNEGSWTVVPPAPGAGASAGAAISWDGTWVFGYSGGGFRWSAGTGHQTIAPLVHLTHDRISLWDCSADGQVIVGYSHRSTLAQVPIVWDPIHGTRSLLDIIQFDMGLTITGTTPDLASALSDDGNVVGGSAIPSTGPTRAWMVTGLRAYIDGGESTPPSVSFASPQLTPHPGAAAPEDDYVHGVALLDPEDDDLPIDVTVSPTDPGGIAATSLLLDGAPLEVETWYAPEAGDNPFVSPLAGDLCLTLGSATYVWAHDQETPIFHQFGDGLAALTGQARNVADPDDVWDVELWFDTVSAPMGGPNLGLNPEWYVTTNDGIINPAFFEYYRIEAGPSVLRGQEANADLLLTIDQPAGAVLQVGRGASNRNLGHGGSGPITFSGAATGTGEVAFDLSLPGVRLTNLVFAHQGGGILGQHTLELSATDSFGNTGSGTQSFAITHKSDFAELWVLQDSLADDGAYHLAALVQMGSTTGLPNDPGGLDMVASTMVVESLDDGTSAPVDLLIDLGGGAQLLLVERDLLRPAGGGPLGANYRVTGRFLSTSGPAFAIYHHAP